MSEPKTSPMKSFLRTSGAIILVSLVAIWAEQNLFTSQATEEQPVATAQEASELPAQEEQQEATAPETAPATETAQSEPAQVTTPESTTSRIQDVQFEESYLAVPFAKDTSAEKLTIQYYTWNEANRSVQACTDSNYVQSADNFVYLDQFVATQDGNVVLALEDSLKDSNASQVDGVILAMSPDGKFYYRNLTYPQVEQLTYNPEVAATNHFITNNKAISLDSYLRKVRVVDRLQSTNLFLDFAPLHLNAAQEFALVSKALKATFNNWVGTSNQVLVRVANKEVQEQIVKELIEQHRINHGIVFVQSGCN